MKLSKYSSENAIAGVKARFKLDEDHVECLIAEVFDLMIKKESLVIDFPEMIVRGHATKIGKNADKISDKFVEVLRGLGYEVSTFNSVNKMFRIRAV